MTRIKLCGLSREEDIRVANQCMPEYVGFVFWEKSRRYVTDETARRLKEQLHPAIKAVGVFVDEDMEKVVSLLRNDIIDMAQLHGNEDASYIRELKARTGKPMIKAFRIETEADIERAKDSVADMVMLDSGKGTGNTFDWLLIQTMDRPFFLAGGLSEENVKEAVEKLNPYAVDVSSGIEKDGYKDKTKMIEFVRAVRSARGKEKA